MGKQPEAGDGRGDSLLELVARHRSEQRHHPEHEMTGRGQAAHINWVIGRVHVHAVVAPFVIWLENGITESARPSYLLGGRESPAAVRVSETLTIFDQPVGSTAATWVVCVRG